MLKSKCNSCGNTNTLDSSHKSGSHLLKSEPKNMMEIDAAKLRENLSKKVEEGDTIKAEDEKDEDPEEERLQLNSEEIGKYQISYLRGYLMNI
jgi:hypothetical protein